MSGANEYAKTGNSDVDPKIIKIGYSEVLNALAEGFEDFWEKPSHNFFLYLVYPFIGFILIRWASTGDAFQLIYPLIAGFALIGPFAALGLYEISRRRELDLDTSWRHAFAVFRSPAIPSILVIGILLLSLLLLWLSVSQGLYDRFYGPDEPSSFAILVSSLLTTSRGWNLLILGHLIGLGFALLVLATTSVALPLLIDRHCNALVAILVSLRVFITNPLPILLWGVVVAILLFIGSLPLFLGLAVVIPVLGHATWHLYRKTVARPVDRLIE